jgi:hypothetical protein
MAVKSRAVSVGTTATALDTVDESDSQMGSSIAVYNNGASTVYVGGSDVTTSNGVPVAAGSWGPSISLDGPERVYGIVASGTVEVRVLEAGI